MGRIVNSTFISLDGVIEQPQRWSLDYFDDDAGIYALQQLRDADGVLMGRKTYDSFADAWPGRSGDDFSDRINSMPKFVVSSSLRRPKWKHTQVLRSKDVANAIARLTESHDLLQYGIGPVTKLLIEHGLLDELRLWVHPVLVGKGRKMDTLLGAGIQAALPLANVTRFGSGVVVLTYSGRART